MLQGHMIYLIPFSYISNDQTKITATIISFNSNNNNRKVDE